ncbi:hypothetical protein [uncultured Mediterranean phage uvMED]|nr:hypothetical protein [uncultured Mediterranean phage uvMED]BAQ84425.1 hypothetical protein [uncultured Mediterranean phage uvMED]BAQ84442.1 hypothetical protein [uncultured Mediterranean phage uvMED]BAQ84507.1 hypothetical protein [uncultured Mediterranean phage uvMED]BAQ84518.1 hypothetical protein [uncultured Mediterranean phage uvMED]
MALSPLNYGRTLIQVLNLAGIEFATLPTVEWRLFRDLLSRRIKFGWQAAKWPSTCSTEQRTVTQTGGDEGNYVALNQPGKTEISEVFAVWNKSPKANQDNQDLTWYLSENGVQIAENNTTVYILFRKLPPALTGEIYSQSTAYNQNDQVYDKTQGNFYVANQSVASGADNSPTTQPTYWDLVTVPELFADYLIRGTYADYLRHNGELDRARVAESDARGALDHELLKLHTQQGQTTRLQVSTY